MEMHARKRQALLAALKCGTVLILLISVFAIAGLRINVTNSLPVGLYRITSDPRASYVAFCLEGEAGRLSLERGYRPSGSCPDGGAPLLKSVVATPGDQVRLSDAGIAVNNVLLSNTAPLRHDRLGRPLWPWTFGDYLVSGGTVWVASTYNRFSYDSRYYGPIRSTQILYSLKRVFILSERN